MPGFEHPPQPDPEPRQVTSRHTSRVSGKLYEVHKLIGMAEALPIEMLPIATFDALKEQDDCWTDKKENRLGPKQFLQLAEQYNNNFNAMLLANPDWAQHTHSVRKANYLEYPLLVTGDSNVIDGMHRLVRAWIDKAKEIQIRRFEKLPEEAELQE